MKNVLSAFKGQKTMQRRGVESLLYRLMIVFIGVAIYRLGVFIPAPGVDVNACREQFNQLKSSGNFLAALNSFFGGTLGQASIFSVGLQPYITASILMRFLTISFPSIKNLQNEGGVGRQKINQYMRYMTVGLAVLQSLAFILIISGQLPVGRGESLRALLTLPAEGFKVYFIMLPCFTAWSIFLMWVCEQMTEWGIHSGTSLIILSNQLYQLPKYIFDVVSGVRQGALGIWMVLSFLVAIVLFLYAVTFFELTYRRIPINYANRPSSMRRLTTLPTSSLPLKFNLTDIMPAIVVSGMAQALSLVMHVLTNWYPEVTFLKWLSRSLFSSSGGSFFYYLLHAALLVMAVYIYTGVNFDPWETADNLKKDKAYIPGVRPGSQTAYHLKKIIDKMVRLTALYFVIVVDLVPLLLSQIWKGDLVVQGVSLLIVVDVIVGVVENIVTHLYSHRYETVLRRSSFWRLNHGKIA